MAKRKTASQAKSKRPSVAKGKRATDLKRVRRLLHKAADRPCPACRANGALKGTLVLDSRLDRDEMTRYRRRACPKCGWRVTTYERVAGDVKVSDREGNVNLYRRERLLESVGRACGGDAILADRVVTDVERGLAEARGRLIEGAALAAKVAEVLWSQGEQVSLVRYLIDQRRARSAREILEILTCLFREGRAGGGPPASLAREV